MKKSIIVIALILVIAMSFLLGRTTSDITGLAIINLEADKKPMPSNRIDNSVIRAYENRIVIYINDAYIANFTDTHSMEPLLDKNSKGIEIVPGSEEEIHIGDIISYKSDKNETIIHRVVEIGYDPEWYAVTKGDNNNVNDPEKIRFGQVERILVGVLY